MFNLQWNKYALIHVWSVAYKVQFYTFKCSIKHKIAFNEYGLLKHAKKYTNAYRHTYLPQGVLKHKC